MELNDLIEDIGVSKLVLAILLISIVHICEILTLRRHSGRTLTNSLRIFISRLLLSFGLFLLALELLIVEI